MNRIIKNSFIAATSLIIAGCVTPPAPEPIVLQPEPEPVKLPKPALLDRIPIFAPPRSDAVHSYRNNAHLLPLKEYISELKQYDKKLPYRR